MRCRWRTKAAAQLEDLQTSVRLEPSGVTESLLGEGAKEGGGGQIFIWGGGKRTALQ